jgi:TatA/E family protein of Tat protein translocase
VTPTAFFEIGMGEMLLIGFVALLAFGGRLPEVMRNLGRSYARFRQGMSEASRPLREEMRRLDAQADPRLPPGPQEMPQAPSATSPGSRTTVPPASRGGAADEPPPV